MNYVPGGDYFFGGGQFFVYTERNIYLVYTFAFSFPLIQPQAFPKVSPFSQYVRIPHRSYQFPQLEDRSPGVFWPAFYVWSTALTLTSPFTMILGLYLFLELNPLFPGFYYFFFLGLLTPSIPEKGYINGKFFAKSSKNICVYFIHN